MTQNDAPLADDLAERLLSDVELATALRSLPRWEHAEGSLAKRFDFDSFAEALAFVNRAGSLAEEADHHPDITISGARVTLSLVTHASGGITAKDTDMASRLDVLASA